MCWLGKCTLPDTPKAYNKLFETYKENFYFKVINEKDKALENDKKRRISQAETMYKPAMVSIMNISNNFLCIYSK